ncbi:MarR family winged helix-turn-helix transcriptional regulator [Deinococcus humi]|uniref:DNA-binding MarR family transcriptional regulator n=1 Tax=Deinococcus humi TaxID=662880 RepID=A0A7W8NFE6_9DEIO|nr:MarR family winged helix-turn-helix transcriptional regulator [Deinococcus humi]MBB5365339.1 DNA-binding MarR family transcriptional regulator [Deinococcus humi]GGO36268.1 transcriptional regulator [Deinococcus humi]
MTTALPPTHDTEDVSRFLTVMWRFNRSLAQEIEPLLQQELDTDPRSFMLLKTIQSGLHYPKLVAQELMMPTTLVSRYLDDLSKRGLIERHIDEQDSRRIHLSLTPAGTALIHDIESTVHAQVSSRLTRLTPDQLRTLNEAMTALTPEGSPA